MTKKTFKIRTPIWKTMSVGLAEYKLADMNYVKILYTDNAGQRMFPNKYKISKEKALKYPKQFVGVDLRIIPIEDLEIVLKR